MKGKLESFAIKHCDCSKKFEMQMQYTENIEDMRCHSKSHRTNKKPFVGSFFLIIYLDYFKLTAKKKKRKALGIIEFSQSNERLANTV